MIMQHIHIYIHTHIYIYTYTNTHIQIHKYKYKYNERIQPLQYLKVWINQTFEFDWANILNKLSFPLTSNTNMSYLPVIYTHPDSQQCLLRKPLLVIVSISIVNSHTCLKISLPLCWCRLCFVRKCFNTSSRTTPELYTHNHQYSHTNIAISIRNVIHHDLLPILIPSIFVDSHTCNHFDWTLYKCANAQFPVHCT